MKCWGEWYGGSSYSPPYPEDREEFASLAEAKRVFIERYDGWDPVSKTRTPCVDEEACMMLYDDEASEHPCGQIYFGPRGGVRRDYNL